MLRRRSDLLGLGLCVMISLPAYALGHRLRDGADPNVALLAGLLLMVVVLSSAIMKQSD
jgi:hypothetical protein